MKQNILLGKKTRKKFVLVKRFSVALEADDGVLLNDVPSSTVGSNCPASFSFEALAFLHGGCAASDAAVLLWFSSVTNVSNKSE